MRPQSPVGMNSVITIASVPVTMKYVEPAPESASRKMK